MLGTARTLVESDTQGTVTMEHTESPRTQVVNQPTLTVRAMKPSSASLTAAIARPPSAHLASQRFRLSLQSWMYLDTHFGLAPDSKR